MDVAKTATYLHTLRHLVHGILAWLDVLVPVVLRLPAGAAAPRLAVLFSAPVSSSLPHGRHVVLPCLDSGVWAGGRRRPRSQALTNTVLTGLSMTCVTSVGLYDLIFIPPQYSFVFVLGFGLHGGGGCSREQRVQHESEEDGFSKRQRQEWIARGRL